MGCAPVNLPLEEIAKQVALMAGFLGAIVALLKGYQSARKEEREAKPPEVAVVGGASFNPGTVEQVLAKITDLASDVRAIANIMVTREKREVEEERESAIRADERERIEREMKDAQRGRRRPPA